MNIATTSPPQSARPDTQHPFLRNLRQRTLEAHTLLETNRFSQAIMNTTISREDYSHFLRRFYGFIAPLEETAYRLHALFPDTERRKRAILLQEDIRTLSDKNTDLSVLPFCNDLPQAETDAQRIGIMYVLEGSTLGGQVISRNVKKALGKEDGAGLAFFSGHREETGKMWSIFLNTLLSFAETTGQEEEIIASAEDTFQKFYTWLEEN